MKFADILNNVLLKKGNAFFYTPSYYTDSVSYLFTGCTNEIEYFSDDDLTKIFDSINHSIADGKPCYGLLNYELGYKLEERLQHLENSLHGSLMKFYFFEKNSVTEIPSGSVLFNHNSENIYSINNFKILTGKEKYLRDIEKIKNFIALGDTYQVNYTTAGEFEFTGSVEAIIFDLIFNQSARYIALINNYPQLIISISPELFFKVEGNYIIAKPMKGTMPRGINSETDENNRRKLIESSKDKSENIMIVDLLRNDLGRICEYDTVNVKNKFELEKYESVFQLTSLVEGQLRTQKFSDIIANLFPCGSITGAPKIRTMEIINELENRSRGIYTGALGFYLNDKMIFNVPIRTIELNTETGIGSIGIGGGVVWDSNPADEYNEALLKAEFLCKPEPYFELIETMLIENNSVFLLDYHIKRLKESADFFLFKFDEIETRRKVIEIADSSNSQHKYKLRMLLDKWGKIEYEIEPVTIYNVKYVVRISKNRVNTNSKFQYFKTTNRRLYDKEFAGARSNDYYDILFLNERNELAESCVSNVIIKKGNHFFTPPISAGILNGCFRQYFLEINENAHEKTIHLQELFEADEVYLCNSVRGMTKVELNR